MRHFVLSSVMGIVGVLSSTAMALSPTVTLDYAGGAIKTLPTRGINLGVVQPNYGGATYIYTDTFPLNSAGFAVNDNLTIAFVNTTPLGYDYYTTFGSTLDYVMAWNGSAFVRTDEVGAMTYSGGNWLYAGATAQVNFVDGYYLVSGTEMTSDPVNSFSASPSSRTYTIAGDGSLAGSGIQFGLGLGPYDTGTATGQAEDGIYLVLMKALRTGGPDSLVFGFVMGINHPATGGTDAQLAPELAEATNFANSFIVPEPASLALLSLGGMMMLRRRVR